MSAKKCSTPRPWPAASERAPGWSWPRNWKHLRHPYYQVFPTISRPCWISASSAFHIKDSCQCCYVALSFFVVVLSDCVDRSYIQRFRCPAGEAVPLQDHFPSTAAHAVRQSDYRGWKTLELSNGLVELQVVPQIGRRVIQYRLSEFDFFWVNSQLAGKQPPESGLAPMAAG